MKDEYKGILGVILMLILISIMWQFITEWIMNLVYSLIGLWKLVKSLEMPHKFYGLTIMLFISWKILESVINLWIKGFEYSFNLIKSNLFAKSSGGEQDE